MKLLRCPLNGPRNISEFVCGGAVRAMPDPANATDDAWADYLYMDANTVGVVDEWWCHVPTGHWFVARRDTRTDEVVATMTVADYFAGPAGDGA